MLLTLLMPSRAIGINLRSRSCSLVAGSELTMLSTQPLVVSRFVRPVLTTLAAFLTSAASTLAFMLRSSELWSNWDPSVGTPCPKVSRALFHVE